ncbi:hypothetical protein V1509DRAFT_624061 [Lipomyces kononenkoae]
MAFSLHRSLRNIACHSAGSQKLSKTAAYLTLQCSAFSTSANRAKLPSLQPTHNANADFKGRKEALLASEKEMYPVISDEPLYQRISDIRKKYDHMSAEELAALDSSDVDSKLTVRGRIASIRAQGNKLLFLDITQEECKIQAIYRLNAIAAGDEDRFRKSWEWLRRGDFVSVTGTLSRTRAGELSVRATSEIKLLSPCLHPIPLTLSSDQTRSHNRTVDLLVHSAARDILRARAFILTYLRSFFSARDFLEVQTPILSDVAGGAAARPFVTHANALGRASESSSSTSTPLELRIAPELWLKRLIISGFDRVFEIGQVFRNEGIDATHNPEFTTCEFYQAFASLDDLISLTEELLSGLVRSAVEKVPVISTNIQSNEFKFDAPFARVDFVSTLESRLGITIPDFVLNSSADSEEAKQYLERLFVTNDVPLPNPPTVARMLDRLGDHVIGPILENAKTPVFLMNFPEVCSPLAKSAKAAGKDYMLARRFELYVAGKELVNAYEEENSPFAQRRKFELQFRDREVDAEAHTTDEGYLASMEWGLPPTGGWGIGIDRLVMLLTGTERISDVLTFGGIKGVVGQE